MSTDSVEIVPDEQVTRLTAIVESSDSAIIGMALDGTTDALTTQRALKELKVPNEMIRMTDREEALEYLQDKNNAKPSLFLLDLNMSEMGGFEFLKTVKANE